MIKLEIGPGSTKLDEDWVTIGPYPTKAVDIVARWGEDNLPFKTCSIDLVYASHVLEHIWWYKTLDALKEVYRILKIGGFLEIHVPNFDVVVESYLKKQCGDSWRKYNKNDDYMTWVNGRIFTYGGKGNSHRAVFNKDYLKKLLLFAGFSDIVFGIDARGYNHGKINLGVRAIKN